MVYIPRIILLLLLADFALSAIFKDEKENADKVEKKKSTNKGKKDRSTSSSSNEKKDESSSGDSLELNLSDSSGSSVNKKKKKKTSKNYKPKSSDERTGWRKWHRKCHQCPEDMGKKWRDPSILWICAGYQRARRSFKSLCMMHYRNCQDGTMFTKIADHRCPNDTDSPPNYRHGDHFFYDYSVDLSMDSSESGSDDSSSESKSKSTSIESKSWDSDQFASYERKAINNLAFRRKD